MNELFAADPAVFSSSSELKHLLASFGPYSGRYLVNYPIGWGNLVKKQLEGLGDIEAERVKTLLRRADTDMTLISGHKLSWQPQRNWLENAEPLLKKISAISASLDGLVAKQIKPPSIHLLDTLELPPTSGERIAGKAGEYARVARSLLLLSPEIALIDPYLDPCCEKYNPVLKDLFEIAADGKSIKITLWARFKLLFPSGVNLTIKNNIENRLRKLATQARFKTGYEIEMILVKDESRQTKMHGRYLLSIKGGVRLDQGFQELPKGRKVEVGPVDKSIHKELLDIYFDGMHDMVEVDRIAFKI